MNWQRLKLRNRLHSLSLLILFLWLKGVGCVVCCTTELIKPLCHNDTVICETSISGIEIPAHADESDCCRQSEKTLRIAKALPSNDEPEPLQIISTGELQVCSLLASQTLAFTVSPKSITSPVIEAASIHLISANIPEVDKPTFTQPLELRNRSGTYLRCCVLLI